MQLSIGKPGMGVLWSPQATVIHCASFHAGNTGLLLWGSTDLGTQSSMFKCSPYRRLSLQGTRTITVG